MLCSFFRGPQPQSGEGGKEHEKDGWSAFRVRAGLESTVKFAPPFDGAEAAKGQSLPNLPKGKIQQLCPVAFVDFGYRPPVLRVDDGAMFEEERRDGERMRRIAGRRRLHFPTRSERVPKWNDCNGLSPRMERPHDPTKRFVA